MKAVLIGTGWRAHFYMRIARLLPDLLQIVSIYTHTEERRREIDDEGFEAFTDLDQALSYDHEAVIISSGASGFFDLLRRLHERGENIVAETTFLSLSEEELGEVADYDGMVREQYQYTPAFAALFKVLSQIEDQPDQLFLSGLHNHHSASIARRILNTGYQMPDEINSLTFPSRMVRTGSRNGMEKGMETEDYERKIRVMRFGEKLFIHDFSSNQYHSYLFGRHFEVRGRSFVITEEGMKTIDDRGYPCFIPFVFHRDSSAGNGSLSLSHVSFGDRTVFENPYYPVNMNDDEIAMAMMIEHYSKGGNPYPFIEGIMDANLGRLL